jgi:hypothetical protein
MVISFAISHVFVILAFNGISFFHNIHSYAYAYAAGEVLFNSKPSSTPCHGSGS